MNTATGLPDLLRRFAATPYRFGAALHSAVVTFETNDQELLTAFRTGAEQLAGVLVSSDKPWYWKMVRDYDVSQGVTDSFLLSGERLSTIFLGTGTVVAIDWDRGELLGFVAVNVPAQHLLDLLLDVARQHHLDYQHGSTRESGCNPNPT